MSPRLLVVGLAFSLAVVGCADDGKVGTATNENGELLFTVTASAGAGGTISPAKLAVADGEIGKFTVAADPGFEVDTVTGCDGALSGTVYKTGAVAEACDVQATFRNLIYHVGGSVAGLAGTGLVLQNKGGDDLNVSINGAFEFTKDAKYGDDYQVTVKTNPTAPLQTCSVTDGAGNVAGDVSSVAVRCVTAQYPVSVTVSGLASGTLVLRNNGGDDLTITSNGTTSFSQAVDDYATFAVTVATQPGTIGRSCKVSNPGGKIDGAPAFVWVACTNYALRFSGGADEVTFASTPTLPAHGEPYTIEAWVKADGAANLGIVAWGNDGTANEAIDFRLTATGLSTSWWGNALQASVGDLSGRWHHVATSWDGTQRRLFVDGAEVASDTPAAPNAIPDGRNFRVGRGFDAQTFIGAIDTLRVWGAAISASTLAAWRGTDVLAAHPDRSDLIAAWSFREGAGDRVTEATGKPGYEGVLSANTAWEPVMPSVTLNPASVRTTTGSNFGVTAEAFDEYHQAVNVTSWSSDNVAIATVSGSATTATVTTLSTSGLARIYANSAEGAYATSLVYARGTAGAILVNHAQTTAAETGTSWPNAFASLSDALLVAESGDEIWVAQGTYTPSAGTERAASFQMKNGVNVYGGFVGNENVRSKAKPSVYTTVLSGELAGGQAKSYHVVEAVGVSATLDGVTVRSGLADQPLIAHHTLGGGIYAQGASLTLSRVNLQGNQAQKGGSDLREREHASSERLVPGRQYGDDRRRRYQLRRLQADARYVYVGEQHGGFRQGRRPLR